MHECGLVVGVQMFVGTTCYGHVSIAWSCVAKTRIDTRMHMTVRILLGFYGASCIFLCIHGHKLVLTRY